MNRLTEAERVLGLDVSASMPGRWYAEEVVEAIVAARLASVEALHVQDDREGHDECVGCRDECLYCEGDHVWPCPTIRVLGSDAHTEQKGTGDVTCAGCGATAPAGTEGWRSTDAPWCPKCAWLA